MKKISIAILFTLFFNIAGKAQTDASATQGSMVNYTALENKLEKSNDDIQDPKKNIKAKTWLSRGTLMNDIYNVNLQYLRRGMSTVEAKLFFKEPKEVKKYEDGPDAFEDHIYDRLTLTYKNGTLDKWEETNKIYDNPLPEAKRSLEEALKLDTEGKESKDIKEQLGILKLAFETEAVFDYNKKDFASAYSNFSQILEINKLPVMENVQDTIIMYNTGRAAYEMKDYKDALSQFTEVKNLGFDESFLYVFIKNCYFGLGDTLAEVNELKEGFEKYPNDESIMIELINYYLVTQQSEKALDFLTLARQRDPSNVSYIFAEGTLRDKMGDFETAKKNYLQCLEIDPGFYNAAYNLGVLHYNRAVKMYEDMINISDDQEYEKAKAEADDMFRAAIPYMEKAREIEPKSKEPLETLKTLYYRLQMNEKYEEVNDLLKSM